MRTLLLDSTYFPVRVINWQKAMILLLTGRAEVVDEYDSIPIRSITKSFKLPRVLRLFSRHKSKFEMRFTRQNVYWRDGHTCQYCAKKFGQVDLTFDHVLPRSKGGPTSWENVVTACQSCNNKKGDKLLKETNMKLLKKAKRPSWTASVCLHLKENDPEEWQDWVGGLKRQEAG